MFSFSGAILLMGMRTGNMMGNANLLKESIQFLIFTTPICLHSNYFPIKLALNKLLVIEESLINIRTLLKQIDPCKFTEIIDEAYIICMFFHRKGGRPPYIRKDLLQGSSGTTRRSGIW
jgi:hypothetical protein